MDATHESDAKDMEKEPRAEDPTAAGTKVKESKVVEKVTVGRKTTTK